MKLKLPFGKRGDKILLISDVESGLSCNCYCPACGSKLIARKGKKKAHHFAHYKHPECEHAFETSIHLFAKDIIAKELKIVLPDLYTKIDDDFENEQIFKSRKIEIDKVILEKKFHEIIPDIIAIVKGKELLIEIAVTHFVDDEKLEKIKDYGVSCIEIDLNYLLFEQKENLEILNMIEKEEIEVSEKDILQIKSNLLNKDKLKKEILTNKNNRKWLVSTNKDKLIQNWIINKEKEIAEERRNKEENEKARIALENKYEKNKINAKLKRYDTISRDESSDFSCPKKLYKASLKFNTTSIIIKDLRDGKFWNGKLYGKGASGKYVFIGGKRYQIFEGQIDKSYFKDSFMQKKVYGQLMRLNNKSATSYFECFDCKYYEGDIDGLNYQFVCSYRKRGK